MFDTLTERLTRAVDALRGRGRLTEDNIADTMRQVRLALLEADVAVPVVKAFTDAVKARAVGEEVTRSLTPGQAFIKIIHDELVRVMGEPGAGLNLRAQPPVIVLLATAGALALGTGSISTVREISTAGWPMAAHITLSALAFGLIATAALLVVVLAAQEASLRSKRPARWLGALPAMESMEHAVFTVLGLGFVCLSATLLIGAFFVTDLFGQKLVHKVTLALVAWAIFGILLLGRHRFGWRGRKARRLVLAGFVALAMSYFLTKFVLEIVLGRHWG